MARVEGRGASEDGQEVAGKRGEGVFEQVLSARSLEEEGKWGV